MSDSKVDRVLFIGPVPPPVNGFTLINAAIRDELAASVEVITFDRHGQGHSKAGYWQTPVALRQAVLIWRFAESLRRHPSSAVYLGLSGGLGKYFDLMFLAIARLFSARIFIHHHSFAYVNSIELSARLCFKMASSACHIVLCACMENILRSNYGISGKFVILSNAAFISSAQNSTALSVGSSTSQLKIGFLSNITREKGIFEFFSLNRRLRSEGVEVNASIAGPVDESIRHEFFSELALSPNITYMGAVYGRAKNEYLSELDILVFPTLYANEAEPVTIYEAMSCGAFVIAIARGCIQDTLEHQTGRCFPPSEFIDAACREVERYSQKSLVERRLERSIRVGRFNSLRDQAAGRLTDLLKTILN